MYRRSHAQSSRCPTSTRVWARPNTKIPRCYTYARKGRAKEECHLYTYARTRAREGDYRQRGQPLTVNSETTKLRPEDEKTKTQPASGVENRGQQPSQPASGSGVETPGEPATGVEGGLPAESVEMPEVAGEPIRVGASHKRLVEQRTLSQMSFREAKPKPDSVTPHLQNPPLWDEEVNRRLALRLDRILASRNVTPKKNLAKAASLPR
jgi:hypothetical protein